MRKRKAYLLWEDPKVCNTEIKKYQTKRDAERSLIDHRLLYHTNLSEILKVMKQNNPNQLSNNSKSQGVFFLQQ